MQTESDFGTGGGTTEHVCAPNPQDTVAIIDNILTRMKSLEDAVTQIATYITRANQLSDIAQQVGWVDGVEYMGVGGWTQTEYGTLIPPPGITLSSLGITIPNVGTPQQLVIMDADGNLVWGAGTDGALSGSAAGIGQLDYGILEYANVGGILNNDSRNVTVSPNIASSQVTMTVANAGLWLVTVQGGKANGVTPMSQVGVNAVSSIGNHAVGTNMIVTAGTISSLAKSGSGLMPLAAGESITATVSSTPSSALTDLFLSILRVTSI